MRAELTSGGGSQARREATAYLSQEDVARLRDELQGAGTPPPDEAQRGRHRALLLGAGGVFALVLGLLVVRALLAPPSPDAPPSAEAPTAAPPEAPPGATDASEAEVPPSVALAPFQDAPRAWEPAGVHEVDAMPYLEVRTTGPGGELLLWVDAHEVLSGQMTRVRRWQEDVDIVYRNTSQALYAHQPCAGIFLADADEGSREPACATPESAEAYCNAVGRRLATPDEWRAILRAAEDRVAPGHGRAWRVRADGPMPARPVETRALTGVRDGYAEVVRAPREIVQAGHLPLLVPDAPPEDPIVVVEGLWTQIRTRQGSADTIQRLSFRCVTSPPEPAAPAARRGTAPARAPAGSARPAPTPVPLPAEAPTPTPVPAPTPAPRRSAPLEAEARPPAEAPGEPSTPTARRRLQLMDPVYLPQSMEDFEAETGGR